MLKIDHSLVKPLTWKEYSKPSLSAVPSTQLHPPLGVQLPVGMSQE